MFANGVVDAILRQEIDDESYYHTLMMFGVLKSNKTIARADKWHRKRLDWDEHVAYMHHTQRFESTYHMTEEAFITLAY